MVLCVIDLCFFFFNDTATTEIYTLSLHDALPILRFSDCGASLLCACRAWSLLQFSGSAQACSTKDSTTSDCRRDRKSTRLNSSHGYISYAVFCLKKKNNNYLTIS